MLYAKSLRVFKRLVPILIRFPVVLLLMTSQNKYKTLVPPTGLGKSYKALPRPTITTANLTFQKTAKFTDPTSATKDNAGKSHSLNYPNGGAKTGAIQCVGE